MEKVVRIGMVDSVDIVRRMLGFGLVIGSLITMCSCGRFEGASAFLREPPKTERLPGIYILDPSEYSYSSLKEQGYTNLSATITLRTDNSFVLSNVPDCCVYGEHGYFGGYFNGSGSWSVEKRGSVFDVLLTFSDIHRHGATNIKQPFEARSSMLLSFTLTKHDSDYGLAAGLFDGEFRYAYFAKNEN